jgi:D-alanyl-D-alanine carboxypeptidase
MVATVVMQLVESGRLRLSDTVDRWLPGLVPGGGRISIDQLLSHRSGLPEYYAYVDTHRSYEPRQLVRIAMTRGKRSPIGSYMYANTNYIVLGLIIEKVTGQPLGRELQRRVFHPAGMGSTSFAPHLGGRPDIRGYTRTTDVTIADLSSAWAAGGVVSSARDLDAFLTALLHGELVAPRTVSDMTTPRGTASNAGDPSYGLGLASPPARCGTWLGHGGRIRGYTTDMWALEGAARSVVVMINDEAGTDAAPDIAEAALCP